MIPDLDPLPSRRRPGWRKRILGSRFLVVSILVHLLFMAGATAWVVQKYQANRKLTFKAGPPSPNVATRAVEHQIQLAKKQNATSAPQAVKRITTTQIAKVSLPDLPAMPKAEAAPAKMAGLGGTGLSAPTSTTGSTNTSTGGGPVSLFGLREPGRDAGLVGTFYDLKQGPGGRRLDMNPGKYADVVMEFVRSGWKDSLLQKYWRGPRPLYAGQVFTPLIQADEGPKAFGVDRTVKPGLWLVLYKGTVSPPESGTYHFVGAGDDVMIVRFDKKVVLDRCYNIRAGFSQPVAEYHCAISGIPGGYAKGEAVALDAAKYYDIEILIGEQPGGEFFAELFVEKEGASYERTAQGDPILPPFRVSDVNPPSPKAGEKLPQFLSNGPIWRARKPGS